MTMTAPCAGETVSASYNPSLPDQQSAEHTKPQPPNQLTLQNSHNIPQKQELAELKKELDNRDETINELKSQLKNLQSIVEALTRENSVLKTASTADDDNSLHSHNSASLLDSPGNEPDVTKERGKSLETEQMLRLEEAEERQTMKGQRPVSMYETREGPKNNWQVTKHQVLICLMY